MNFNNGREGGLPIIVAEKMKSSNRRKTCSTYNSRYVAVSLIVVFAVFLTFINTVDINLKAQSDGIIDSNLRRPTTTKVISEKYTAPTQSNHNLSTNEIQPIISKGFSEDKNLEAPLAISPSYTITNTSLTFGTAILRSDYVPNQVNVFTANSSSPAIIEGTSP